MMALGWGSMSMLQAATTNFAGIMTLRFLVGAFEAGFVPAVALYLTFFYHRSEMGLRYGLFISFSPLASCFASALAYGLVHAKTSIHNWKLLFLVGKSSAKSHISVTPCLTKILVNRGRSDNLPRGRCLLLPSTVTIRMPLPYTSPERDHQPARLQGPRREKRWKTQLQAGIFRFRGLQELPSGDDHLLPQHSVRLSPRILAHHSGSHGLHLTSRPGLLGLPLPDGIRRLCHGELRLRPIQDARYLRHVLLLRGRGRLRDPGDSPHNRGSLLRHLPSLRRRLPRRGAHLHMGDGQPGLRLQARCRSGHLRHGRPVRPDPGRASVP